MQARTLLPSALLLSALVVSAPADAQTLRGSRASVQRIHRQAVDHGLTFYPSSAAVQRAVANGELVRLRKNADYQVGSVSHPYVLPVVETFVARLGVQYRSACGERLVVTSAVRPQSVRLANSVEKSVHPTGMAIDLRRPSNPRCLAWLRRTLLALEAAGVIEAVEERRPPHFHVAVFPSPYRHYVQRRGGEPAFAAAAAEVPRNATQTMRYRVRRGDSLWTIAQRHGRTVEEIKRANDLRSSRIVAGQLLVIPQAR